MANGYDGVQCITASCTATSGSETAQTLQARKPATAQHHSSPAAFLYPSPAQVAGDCKVHLCNFTFCCGLHRQTVPAAHAALHLLLQTALQELQLSAQTRQAAVALPARLLHATATLPPAALFPTNYLASAAMTLHPAGSASAVCANWLLHLHLAVSATTQLYTNYSRVCRNALHGPFKLQRLSAPNCKSLLPLQLPSLHWSKPALLATCSF